MLGLVSTVKQAHRSSKTLTNAFKPAIFTEFLLLDALLNRGRHHTLRVVCNKLIVQKQLIAYYFLAKSQLLCHQIDDGLNTIEHFLSHYPHHIDALYLKANLLIQAGNQAQAKSLLHDVLTHSKRGKTWQLLAHLVENESDFIHYRKMMMEHHDLSTISYDLACHLTDASYRGNHVDWIYAWWQEKYAQHQRGISWHTQKKPKSFKKINCRHATHALMAFKRIMDKHNIDFFLIGGTLLGCIRESNLLGHDKDIDVGVFDSTNHHDLENVCRQSGVFYVLPSATSDQILVIRHLNGTTIDIFFHTHADDKIYHGGGKCLWYNSYFELSSYHFLGTDYLIPKDYELYLCEHYGDDWRIPKVAFDSALDTPNMQIVDVKKYEIYLYKKFFATNHTRYIKKLGIANS